MGVFPFPTDPAALPLRAAYPHASRQVKRGDTVVVAESGEPWRIADVISVYGGPRGPTVPDCIQVINMDPVGWVRWIDTASVLAIMEPR
jgi:hypothetical protein